MGKHKIAEGDPEAKAIETYLRLLKRGILLEVKEIEQVEKSCQRSMLETMTEVSDRTYSKLFISCSAFDTVCHVPSFSLRMIVFFVFIGHSIHGTDIITSVTILRQWHLEFLNLLFMYLVRHFLTFPEP